MNQVNLIGRVGKDPQVRATQAGMSVCSFTLATNEKIKGEDVTEWHNITAWGKQADVIAQYVHKGDMLRLTGKLQTREWEKDGVKRYSTEIHVREFEFISTGKRESKPAAKEEAYDIGELGPPLDFDSGVLPPMSHGD